MWGRSSERSPEAWLGTWNPGFWEGQDCAGAPRAWLGAWNPGLREGQDGAAATVELPCRSLPDSCSPACLHWAAHLSYTVCRLFLRFCIGSPTGLVLSPRGQGSQWTEERQCSGGALLLWGTPSLTLSIRSPGGCPPPRPQRPRSIPCPSWASHNNIISPWMPSPSQVYMWSRGRELKGEQLGSWWPTCLLGEKAAHGMRLNSNERSPGHRD